MDNSTTGTPLADGWHGLPTLRKRPLSTPLYTPYKHIYTHLSLITVSCALSGYDWYQLKSYELVGVAKRKLAEVRLRRKLKEDSGQ